MNRITQSQIIGDYYEMKTVIGKRIIVPSNGKILHFKFQSIPNHESITK
jgi:hypothetical protein